MVGKLSVVDKKEIEKETNKVMDKISKELTKIGEREYTQNQAEFSKQ